VDIMTNPDLPTSVPIFPLTGALLLPRARLPLHIFEPRYIAMLEECMKTQTRLIGMIQSMGPENERLASIGCAGRLTSFSETDDGRYMITLTGMSRFRLGAEIEGFSPFRRFNVTWQGFERDRAAQDEDDKGLDRTKFMALMARYFEMRSLGVDWKSLSKAEPELLVNALSMLLPLPPEDKQALLEAPSLTDRRQTLTALVEFALHQGDDGNEMMQ
jgi:Lon protease-like protein